MPSWKIAYKIIDFGPFSKSYFLCIYVFVPYRKASFEVL